MAQTPGAIAHALEHFIRREFRIPAADRSFHRDTHLYDAGFVDSAGFAELMAFLESRFAVELPAEDIFSDDFTTINGISGLVHRHLARQPPRARATASGPTFRVKPQRSV